jgi:hypothetical protein
MPIADLPPRWVETVECALRAAPEYGVPANVVLAVAEMENGSANQCNRNRNGSVDCGQMQINSVHFGELGRYGITVSEIAAPGCYQIELGAWIIRQRLDECSGEFWRCVATYHSKSPDKNAIYRKGLIPAAAWWGRWLQANYTTVEYVNHSKGH